MTMLRAIRSLFGLPVTVYKLVSREGEDLSSWYLAKNEAGCITYPIGAWAHKPIPEAPLFAFATLEDALNYSPGSPVYRGLARGIRPGKDMPSSGYWIGLDRLKALWLAPKRTEAPTGTVFCDAIMLLECEP